jgi:hypothetical protein
VLLVLPFGCLSNDIQLLGNGSKVIEFAEQIRKTFPTLIKKNPLLSLDSDDESDDEKEKSMYNKEEKKNDSQHLNTHNIMINLIQETQTNIVPSLQALKELFDVKKKDLEALEAAILADGFHSSTTTPFLYIKLPPTPVSSSPTIKSEKLVSEFNFAVLYTFPKTKDSHYMDIPLLRHIDVKNVDQVIQDATVLTFGSKREATKHGAGKNSEEMVQNIRMRHASGTFCSLVYPSTTWNIVCETYHTQWPCLSKLKGELRLRRFVGQTTNSMAQILINLNEK